MQIIAVDFETFYDKDYSLSKMTTEQYIRSPLFEVIMVGLRMPDGNKFIITGTHEEIKWKLDRFDWSQYAMLAHNNMFDAAILSWVFDIRPKVLLDTLSMSRAMFGGKGNSLAALAIRYNLEEKGTTVHNMMGRRRESLSATEFKEYANYCEHDVDLCYDLFHLMAAGWYDLESADKRAPYPMQELELIDVILKMYTEPVLHLNKPKLIEHLAEVQQRKEGLLASSGVDKDDLMSNPKFAVILDSFGVAPPMKVSPTTGNTTYAFAKTDPGMKELLEHHDERVQAVVAARMGVKSTLEETRTLRFIDIAGRGLFPVPLKYSAARTHRLGGTDKVNLQNLPARGLAGNKLKSCIEAPPGYVIIDCDSSNIEARVLAWLAVQDDLVEDFANNVDVYCKMASRIYGMPVTKENKQQRFVGKTVILGCGYQTGKVKLQATLKAATPPMELDIDTCDEIIKTYRQMYHMIPLLWRQGDIAIEAMYHDKEMWLGKEGVLLIEGKKGVRLPNGLYISYPQLHRVPGDKGRDKWVYKDTTGLIDIYGGKLIENIVQALARIIVTQQLLKISRRYKVVLTVHDAVACIAKKEEAGVALEFVEQCMRWTPKWALGCPINCESGIGENYGDC
jgi:DNA polymerase I-like protein with 3'-5' exonuclease and polymerase domains